jgi:hypothetical protein
MKKIGKVALAAAPYVAAPFTGGASLAFAPMTKTALGAWNAHDANSAAAKGLAPSKFDRILGIGTDVAGMAGGAGALGGLGKSFGAAQFNTPATSLGGKMGTLAKVGQGVMDRFGGQGQGGYSGPQYGGGGGGSRDYMDESGGVGYGGGGRAVSRGGGGGQAVSRYNPGNVMGGGLAPSMNAMGMMDQNNPNLAAFIGQGRSEAINDQPFRRGYTTNYLGSDDETPYTQRMPKIGSVQPQRNKKRQRETVN